MLRTSRRRARLCQALATPEGCSTKQAVRNLVVLVPQPSGGLTTLIACFRLSMSLGFVKTLDQKHRLPLAGSLGYTDPNQMCLSAVPH